MMEGGVWWRKLDVLHDKGEESWGLNPLDGGRIYVRQRVQLSQIEVNGSDDEARHLPFV